MQHSITARDEHGEPEVWDVVYRRLTGADLIAAARLQDTEGAEAIRLVVEQLDAITLSIRLGHKRIAAAAVPFDVAVEIYSAHPSFRGDAAA